MPELGARLDNPPKLKDPSGVLKLWDSIGGIIYGTNKEPVTFTSDEIWDIYVYVERMTVDNQDLRAELKEKNASG